ncbi:MAG: DinB family protein [bacterium]
MRARLLLVAAIMLPVAARAQQSVVAAPNAATQAFKSFGPPYGGWLLLAFDSIPASKYDYKPTAPQQSIGQIAQHLEYANYGQCERFSPLRHARTPKDSLADTIKAQWPKDTLIARLRASLVFCAAAIDSVTDAQLGDQLPVGAPGSNQTSPRVRFLLLLVTDLAEHYSQISGYMRLLGMVPPSALPRPAR